MDCVSYWLFRDYLCVLFFCSVFSIICYVISISNYRRPSWMAKAFLATFHIVSVTFCTCVCIRTCIVENNFVFILHKNVVINE